ncbi:hypothetical protein [Acinetobacter populi]
MQLLSKRSMKTFILTISCLLTSTMLLAQTSAAPQQDNANADDSAVLTPSTNENTIQVITRPEILGQWGMKIPNNRQCTEYYNFRGNNEVVIKSDKEWSIGQYQYQVPNNRSEQLPALIMQIQYDNNEKDCSGYQEDQTGEIQQFFVKWINPQQIEFCGTDKGEKCFATLNKQLP